MRPLSSDQRKMLGERLRCADPTARVIVEAQVEQRRDVRQRKSQWQAADLVVLRSQDFPAGNNVTAVAGTTEVTLANAPAANDFYEVQYKVSITPIVPGAGTNTHELVVAVETDLTGGGTWAEQFQFIYTLKRKAGESANAVTWKVERALIRVTGITSTGKVRLKAKSFTAPGGATFSIHGFNLATDADPLSGVKYHTGPKLDFLDDGVSLGGAIVTKISNAVSDGFETDFGGPPTTLPVNDPVLCARIVWGKDDSPDIAIDRITAFLHPKQNGAQAKTVAFWVCQPWALRKSFDAGLAGFGVDLVPLCPPVVAQAGEGTAAGDVTFSFFERTYQLPWGPVVMGRKPRPKSVIPEFKTPPTALASEYDQSPTTFVFVWGAQADGTVASNIGWGRDSATTSITNGSRKLRTVRVQRRRTNISPLGAAIEFLNAEAPVAGGDPARAVLRLKIETGTYASETLAFTGVGNRLDLGASPTDTIELVGVADVPTGSSATFQIRNDADTAWVTYTDGQTFADLGLTQTQTRKVQCPLAPNTEGDATPVISAMGMRDLKRSRSETATVRRYLASMDPVTLKARQPEAVITAIRDGERDFHDWVTELLSDNHLNKIAFRIFVGDPSRSRSEWLHIDDFRPEDYEPGSAEIEIQGISALELLKRALPKYNTTTQKREPLAYANKTPKQVFDDIVDVKLALSGRHRGHGLEDESALLAKTITDSDAKAELDAVAHIAGAAISTSQGKIQAFPFFGPAAVRAIFPSAEIQLLSITPGFRQRVPEFHAKYNWSDTEQRFQKEVRVEHGNALLNLDIVGLDPPRTLEEEIARWIPDDEALARRVAERRVNTLGTGLIYARFRSIYAYPELEFGDVVAIETDQFVARDPNLGRALRGQLWVNARIAEVGDALGIEFGAWIQSYADIFGAPEAGTQDAGLTPIPVPTASILGARAIWRANRLFVQANGGSAVNSMKFATSTVSYPAAGTGTVVDTDANNDAQFDAGTFVYSNTVRITITPYPLAAAGGTAGPARRFRARLSYLDLLMEELSGKLIRSTSYSDENFALVATTTNGLSAASGVQDSRALALNTMFGKTADDLDDATDGVTFKKVTGVTTANKVTDASIDGARVRRHRHSNTTAAGTGAATVETDLMSHTLPTLADGDMVEYQAEGGVSGSNAAKTVRIRLGGSVIITISFTAAQTGRWAISGYIIKRGANADTWAFRGAPGIDSNAKIEFILTAPDPSGAILKISGETPNANDEVTAEVFFVTVTQQ